jgi:hypothetical protein
MKNIYVIIVSMSLFFVMNSLVFAQDTYYQFGSLNWSSVTVSSSWTKLVTTSGTHSFEKSLNDSEIEIHVNSRFRVGSFNSATGIRFEVRIDDVVTPDYDNAGSIRTSDTQEFLSIFAVFEDIPAGSHTVSIWARANSGSVSDVTVDPGGWGGSIIVKLLNDTIVGVTSEGEEPTVPGDYTVQQNYPNPFNPSTQISYTLQKADKVEIVVYNIHGQKVKTLVSAYQSPGNKSVVWDGTDDSGNRLSSGIYVYKVTAGEHSVTKKMTLAK